MSSPGVILKGPFTLQACFPAEWSDEEGEAMAEKLCPNPQGQRWGKTLQSYRMPCWDKGDGFVHLIFEA